MYKEYKYNMFKPNYYTYMQTYKLLTLFFAVKMV